MNEQTLTQDTDLVTYAVDPSHSQVGFTVRHMGFTKVRGRFEEFEGTIHMDPDKLETLKAEATIKAASITTNEEKRDQHLRSGDFLLAEEYPELTFSSLEARDVSGSSFTLVGDLTIRGVTKSVELDARYHGQGQDPWGGTRVAFEAHTTINRKEFGVNWNQVLEAGGLLVSEDVEINLEIQAVQQD